MVTSEETIGVQFALTLALFSFPKIYNQKIQLQCTSINLKYNIIIMNIFYAIV